jgi:hypothetical protein
VIRQLKAVIIVVLWAVLFAHGQTPTGSSSKSTDTYPKNSAAKQPPVIVIGFVGGFVRHDDSVHSPVQLGARLRAGYATGVYSEVFENRRREDAHQSITKLLDTNQDGNLSDEEKGKARIILYGMSWGGSETLELARELDREHIPVLLTIQVDSVAKHGQDSRHIPANVAEAANFYQTGGVLHGEPEIVAVDPSRTKILGNYRYDYADKPIDCPNYPWYDRVFTKQHTEIECDPAVWSRVEALIRSQLPTVQSTAAEARNQ